MSSLGDTKQDKSAQCPCYPLGLGRVLGRGHGQDVDPSLPPPHLACVPTGEHEWKIVSTGITDCYFNVTELPPGSAARFRVACVNKAGQGPYSTPSGKVHLKAAGEQALSHGVWGQLWGCSLWDALGVLESQGIFTPGLWGMGHYLHSTPSLHSWLIPPFPPCRCPSCSSQGHRCPSPCS